MFGCPRVYQCYKDNTEEKKGNVRTAAFIHSFLIPLIRSVVKSRWLSVITAATAGCSLWTDHVPPGTQWEWSWTRRVEAQRWETDCLSDTFVMENNRGFKLLTSIQLEQRSPCIWYFFPLFMLFPLEQMKALLVSAWHSDGRKLQVMVDFSWMLWAILMSTKEDCIKWIRI